jgi:hypothetical protein
MTLKDWLILVVNPTLRYKNNIDILNIIKCGVKHIQPLIK